MALIPLGHRVLVKADDIEKVSEGGIHLVLDEKLEEAGQQIGTIVALGEDCWKAFRKVDGNGKEVNGQPWAKVGDKVLYARYAGKIIVDPDSEDKLFIMNDEDILCRVGE